MATPGGHAGGYDFPPLKAEDIADAAVWVATRPPHVDVTEMVVLPTAQATAILNHREG